MSKLGHSNLLVAGLQREAEQEKEDEEEKAAEGDDHDGLQPLHQVQVLGGDHSRARHHQQVTRYQPDIFRVGIKILRQSQKYFDI